ncbi:MAG: preprotein translocase subunit SecG [Defluviitaleaceae bacterium]|nr:preprotein translocase subunit SecG [Defluviitaleaceae bacterium]
MSPLFIPLAIVYIVLCVGLIVIVLMQKKRQAGLGAGLAGGAATGSSGGSFYDKNKSNTLEGKLEKYTKLGGALFFALSMVLGLLA